jgi:transposase
MELMVVVGAGLDVHKKSVFVCCLDSRSNPPKISRATFGTFQDELERMRDWLVERGCTHVAMESTGVYWMPVYRVLEGRFDITLGNARHMANVPGRKTDVSDSEWIAQLLRFGLIQKNFVPPREFRDLRLCTRYRRRLVQSRTAAQLRVDKLLETAGVKLSSVASNLFGVSGRRMLAALAHGETDPVRLASLALGRLRKKEQQMIRAFGRCLSPETARLLELELHLIDDLNEQITRTEALLEERVSPHEDLIRRLDTIPGVDRTIAIDLIAETALDMTQWKSDRHFTAWAGTCPGNRLSAGVRKQARARDGNPYVKTLLIQAAVCASQTVGSYLAKRHGRLAARRGPRKAAVATARHIAIAVYHIIRDNQCYQPPKIADPARAREIEINRLLRKLNKLGVQLQQDPTT